MEKSSKDLLIKLLEDVAAADPKSAAEPTLFSGSNAYNQYDVIQQVKDEVDCGKSLMDFLETYAKKQGVPLDDFMRERIRPYDPVADAAARQEAEQKPQPAKPKSAPRMTR